MPLDTGYWTNSAGRKILGEACGYIENHRNITPNDISRFQNLHPGEDRARLAEAISFALLIDKARKTGKLPADFWLFTRDAYEQSSAPAIAQRHASKFSGCKNILEICAGVGCDTLALSDVADNVVAYEADYYVAGLARINLDANNVRNARIIAEQAEQEIIASSKNYEGLWADPARRNSSRRVFSPGDYSPPLNLLIENANAPISGIKISPAANIRLPRDWAREWIGIRDECREQTLWRGADITDGAVWLADKQIGWAPSGQIPAKITITNKIKEGGFIIEPHAAIIRSGFLSSWFEERAIELLDLTIAYGYSSLQPEKNPFSDIFEVICAINFSIKNLRNVIANLKFTADAEIKKRGFPETPDEVRRKLKFSDSGEAGVVILTRYKGDRIAVLCRRII